MCPVAEEMGEMECVCSSNGLEANSGRSALHERRWNRKPGGRESCLAVENSEIFRKPRDPKKHLEG